ncbi:MAG: deoxyhypusine synthase family protein, partial [Deltaproteobacteria bacterium]|nr:deoxyhypusine synthase family protein [Deltaproteobacteria bacterium]
MSTVREFMEKHFLHFNSRDTLAAAKAYEAHIRAGGKMLVAMAGAMSTARIGRILSRMIRNGFVHAVSCTGANLEEDIYQLISGENYKMVPDWRALSPEEEKRIFLSGYSRVTDTCIPEEAMRVLWQALLGVLKKASERGERKLPSEFVYEVLRDPSFSRHFQRPKEESWVYAAMEAGIPIYTPGWEDSTSGNKFAASVWKGELPHHQMVKTGTEQMESLIQWYMEASGYNAAKRANRRRSDGSLELPHPSVGFFQIGGGIAGDFAICAVPTIIKDLHIEDLPFWGYFAQVSDAITSYGGYSGAVPNEKITWGKLDVNSPR